MQTLILTFYIIICILLIILILLQSGKEGMGVIFGGGNSSVFGSAGAGGILAKLTTLMAIIFAISSLAYTYSTSSRPASESVILNVEIEAPAPETAKKAEDASAQNSEQAKDGETATPAVEQKTAPAVDEKAGSDTDNGKPATRRDNPKPDSAEVPAAKQ